MTASELTRHQERAVECDVDDGAPGIRRHVFRGHREIGGRVVHEHRGQLPLRLDLVEALRDLIRIADVARNGHHVGAHIAERREARLEMIGLPRCDAHPRAQPAELDGDRLAQARTPTGDDDDLISESARRERCYAKWWWFGKAHPSDPSFPLKRAHEVAVDYQTRVDAAS